MDDSLKLTGGGTPDNWFFRLTEDTCEFIWNPQLIKAFVLQLKTQLELENMNEKESNRPDAQEPSSTAQEVRQADMPDFPVYSDRFYATYDPVTGKYTSNLMENQNEKEPNRPDTQEPSSTAQEVRQAEHGDKTAAATASGLGEGTAKPSSFSKVVNIKVDDIEDLVPRLETMLDMAKKGLLTDFVAVYDLGGEPSFTISYRSRNRFRVIGMLQTVLQHLVDKFELI